MIDGAIYFDSHATTPLLSGVWEAMVPYFTEHFAVPGSVHRFGRESAKAVSVARSQVQRLLGAKRPSEVVFCASGTEANNLAILGVGLKYPGCHFVVSAGEHNSVLDPMKVLEKRGHSVSWIPLLPSGSVDIDSVEAAIKPETMLVSVGMANFEIGTICDIGEVKKRLPPKGVLLHCDAQWAPGWVDLDVQEMGIDLLAISAHRFGGPKGVGALYIRRGVRLPPVILGGYQERGRRPGSENTPGIVGMGVAAEAAQQFGVDGRRRVGVLRNTLLEGLRVLAPDLHINGAGASGILGLPGCLNVSFPGLEGESLLLSLDMEGLAVSSGAACTSGTLEPSHVLEAMGLSPRLAHGSVRFSLGFQNNASEVSGALERCAIVIRRQKKLAEFL